ncbi:hypothetical protein F4V43_02545 [Paenibacillus spiritus]|uniref:Uncharacterized protein n=1 Tax=Paenibacillus spiritus TaxID=2496557 RepID=A0A5J5GGQ0_9BACL|nr:hypothetical protein [Paenibacillus spiritus]KAA9007386.1 hypothetical protein F4V43_02545 [Paenibacillus spiritus]
MARFKQVNENIENIMVMLADNQNLCKLLFYPSNNPYQEPEIDDTSSLFFTKIFPFPKIPDVKDEAGSYLSIYFDRYRIGSNRGTKEGCIVFTAIVHNNLWRMENTGELRPYSLLHEIDETINRESGLGIKKIEFDSMEFVYVNESYSGYRIIYQISSVN